MTRSQRRLALLVGVVVALLLAATLVYSAGMARLEGETRGFWDALQWAAETLTTTGYGHDSEWTHPRWWSSSSWCSSSASS